MNTCTRVTVWHVAFHRPGPPVVLASTRDTLPRGIPYVYAPRLFNSGRSVALKRYKKPLLPQIRENRIVFSLRTLRPAILWDVAPTTLGGIRSFRS